VGHTLPASNASPASGLAIGPELHLLLSNGGDSRKPGLDSTPLRLGGTQLVIEHRGGKFHQRLDECCDHE
jgi:hypothetical protein